MLFPFDGHLNPAHNATRVMPGVRRLTEPQLADSAQLGEHGHPKRLRIWTVYSHLQSGVCGADTTGVGVRGTECKARPRLTPSEHDADACVTPPTTGFARPAATHVSVSFSKVTIASACVVSQYTSMRIVRSLEPPVRMSTGHANWQGPGIGVTGDESRSRRTVDVTEKE